jgi:hypothetical protein
MVIRLPPRVGPAAADVRKIRGGVSGNCPCGMSRRATAVSRFPISVPYVEIGPRARMAIV